MNEQQLTAAVLSELHSLRILLTFGVVFVGIMAFVGMVRVSRVARHYVHKELGDLFRHEATDLFEKGKLDDVIARCNDRLAKRPNDEYALWFLARALYLTDAREPALEAFRRLRRLNPGWAEQHIDPFVREIGEGLAPPPH